MSFQLGNGLAPVTPWTIRAESTEGYLRVPDGVDAAVCTVVDGCSVCFGGYEASLFGAYASFMGEIIALPQRIPATRAYAVWLHTYPCQAMGQPTSSDLAGTYDFNRNAPPDYAINNWAFRLPHEALGQFGPSTYDGILSLSQTDCTKGARGTVSSSQQATVNLTVYEPILTENDPTLRCDCDGPGPTQGGCTVGEPINVLNGNMFLDHLDVRLPTRGRGLALERSYNSQLGFRSIGSAFGPGWTHSYERTLTLAANGVAMVRQQDGAPRFFTDQDGNQAYVASVPITEPSSLSLSGTTYIRHLKEGGEEHYEGTGTTRRLARLMDTYGNVTHIQRDAQSRILTVSGPGTRSLTFAYDGPNPQRISSVSHQDGLVATYEYLAPAHDLLERVTYADGRGFEFVYTADRQLLTVADLTGRILESHTYQGDKAITSEIADGQERLTLSYGLMKTTVTDSSTPPNTSTYEWTNIDGAKYVTNVEGSCSACGTSGQERREWHYDEQGRVLEYADGNGNVTTYDYGPDGSGQTLTIKDSAGGTLEQVTILDHDPTTGMVLESRVPSVVANTMDKRTQYQYAQGSLTSVTETGYLGSGDPYTYVTQYGYDPGSGKMTSIDGPRTDVSDVIMYSYDAATGDLLSVTEPGLGTTSYESFNGLGLPQIVRDGNQDVSTYTYDGRGRVLQRTRARHTTTFEYSPTGSRTRTQLPRGNSQYRDFDQHDRVARIRDHYGNYVKLSYDVMGRRIQEEVFDDQDVLRRSMSFAYDGYGRLQSVTRPDGLFSLYSYDASGNLKTERNPRGLTTQLNRDTHGRVTIVTAPAQGLTRYTYNAHDALAVVTDAKNRATTSSYDDMGRRFRVANPETGRTSYSYDAAGNVIGSTDSRGVVKNYSYDAANRLTLIDVPSGVDTSYTYDAPCAHGRGRLCRVSNEAGIVTYEYDEHGNLVEETLTGTSGILTTRYAYDANGNPEVMTYPSGRIVRFEYDMFDRISRITTTPPGGSVQTVVDAVEYEPFGPLRSLTYGNGLDRSISYDQQGQVESISTPGIQEVNLVRDGNGNLLEVENVLQSVRSRKYYYDDADRVRKADAQSGALAWEYDELGNRVTFNAPEGVSIYSYSPDSSRLQSVSGAVSHSYTYDSAGNMTAQDNRIFAYDDYNRLSSTQLVAGTPTAYSYDHTGERATKTTGSLSTRFVYDQKGGLIAESSTSQLLEYIWLDRLPIAQVDSSGLLFIHTDDLGTPIAMSNSGGYPVWDAGDRRPFGEGGSTGGSPGTNLRFPGQYEDGEGPLFQNWHRYYVPELGRYTQPDPLSAAGRARDYSYAENNPVSRVDPSGLSAAPPTPFGTGPCSFRENIGCREYCATMGLQSVHCGILYSAPFVGVNYVFCGCRDPGDRLGDCTPQQHASLQNMVEYLCKGAIRAGCAGLPDFGRDCCPALWAGLATAEACRFARLNINRVCYKGQLHGASDTSIKDAEGAIRKCTNKLKRAKCI